MNHAYFQNVQNVKKDICYLFLIKKTFLKNGNVQNAGIQSKKGNQTFINPTSPLITSKRPRADLFPKGKLKQNDKRI